MLPNLYRYSALHYMSITNEAGEFEVTNVDKAHESSLRLNPKLCSETPPVHQYIKIV